MKRRLGFSLPIQMGIPVPDLVGLAIRADDAGFDSIGIGESASSEAFVLSGAIAASVRSSRIETAVVPILSRSPALLAMSAVTAAALAPQGFVLGLGSGSQAVAHWHEAEWAKPIARARRFIAELRRIIAGEPPPEPTGFRLAGIPTQPVPIHLAALNKGMIRLAAQVADGIVLTFVGPNSVRDIVSEVRADRSDDFEVVVSIRAYTGPDEADARLAARRDLSTYASVPTYRGVMERLLGPDLLSHVQELRGHGARDDAMQAIPEESVDEILATGSGAELMKRAEDLWAAGADMVRIVPVTLTKGDASAATSVIEAVRSYRR